MAAAPHSSTGDPAPRCRLSDIYDQAVVDVYRYLRARCDSAALAEELTSATFVQATIETTGGTGPEVSIRWLITVARHKLVDHWRHQAMANRKLELLDRGQADHSDPWVAVLDQARAQQVLAAIAPDHRAALTLRYLDDLSVPECADVLGRSVHATESLLVRARTAFRTAYEQTGGHHD